MIRTSAYGLAVLLIALLAPAAWADSISYDTGQPTSPAAGRSTPQGPSRASAQRKSECTFTHPTAGKARRRI
jgi:hypothetical protein